MKKYIIQSVVRILSYFFLIYKVSSEVELWTFFSIIIFFSATEYLMWVGILARLNTSTLEEVAGILEKTKKLCETSLK